jgi:uncharacterized membrane protein YdcZ (DUF606 family)
MPGTVTVFLLRKGVRVEYLTGYVVPGLTFAVIACGVYFVIRCVLLVFHFAKLKTLGALRRGQPASAAMVDTEMMVMRDKRHMGSSVMGAILMAAAIYGINWYVKHGGMH